MLKKIQSHGSKCFVLLSALMWCCTSNLVAQEKLSTPIEQYLDISAAIVGWLDVNEADLPALQAFAKKYDIETGPMTEAQGFQKALKAVGVKRVFVIASLSDMMSGGPLVVLPSEPEKVETVQLLFSTSLPAKQFSVVTHGSNVLIGMSDVVNRYLTMTSERPVKSFVSEINAADLSNALVFRVPAASAVFLSPVLPNILKGLKLKNPLDIKTVGQVVMSTQTVSLCLSVPPNQAKLKAIMSTEESAATMSSIFNQIMTEKASDSSGSLTMQVTGKTALVDLANEQAVASAMDGLMQLLTPARTQARETQQKNSMKQIGLAMHNFYDAYKALPPQALASKDGKKLLSWRVLILPFLDQNELYQQFHLDEPWDSEHNIRLASKMPPVYAQPGASGTSLAAGKTRLQVPLLENSAFGRSGGGTTFREITDGTSNTVMIVQVPQDKSVTWTKPDDVVVDPENPADSLIDPSQDRFLAGFCDGSVRRILTTVSKKTLIALLTMNGGEIVDNDEL